jgi:NADH-quinone oxidoreductase subunit M
MDSSALLIIALFLPLVGAAVVFLLGSAGRDAVRNAALAFSFATLLVTGVLVADFPKDPEAMRNYAVANYPWVPGVGMNIGFHIGLDGLGLWMFGLSALLMVTAVLVSWDSIEDRPELFYGMLLLLQFGCLGVFAARDLILFYVFFEFTLIPLFFLIGIWGSEDRRYAAIKFFLYTLAGSVLTFLGLLTIVFLVWTRSGPETSPEFSIPALAKALASQPIDPSMQLWIFLALFAGFAIKVPLFPVHTWLPLAHVQAPAAGSVILAGILLKIGVYGFVRFSMTMLPDATVACAPWILTLAVAGIVYGALVALAQSDMKRLIAYSSVSHLGYCIVGLFAMNQMGMTGGILQMISHGLSTGGLFAIIGMLYQRYHTREINSLSGLASRTPILATFMVLFTFSSIGVPGLNGFPGEFLVLCGIFQRAWQGVAGLSFFAGMTLAVAAVSGVVLGAWYMLQLVQRVFFGPLKEPAHDGHDSHHDSGHDVVPDLSWTEITALALPAVFVFWIGIRPNDFTAPMQPAIADVQKVLAGPLERAKSAESMLTEAPSPEASSPSSTETTRSRATDGEGFARAR